MKVEPRNGEQEETHQDQQTTSEEPPVQPGPKPLVYIKTLSDGVPITPGQYLKIVCLVNEPNAQVSFSHPSKNDRVKSESDGSMTHELEFNPFEAEDAGKFRCIARNKHGVDEDTAVIELEADGSFTFITGLFGV